MTTKHFLSFFLIASLTLVSCKKELEPQESSPVSDVLPPANPNAPNPNSAATPAPVPAQPQMQMAPNGNVVTMNPAAPAPVAKGMNPAHGQPGHRCDIPVGAPLNSPPGQQNVQQTTQVQNGNKQAMPQITKAVVNPDGSLSMPGQTNTAASGTPAILAPPVATPEGMNPPHGQAGHRCDVAVGAALPKS